MLMGIKTASPKDVETVYLLENLHPHSQCVWVNLIQLVEVAEDHSIFWKTIGGTC